MIIIGYQGIGKSTLASKNMWYIDLESGNFWYDDDDLEARVRDRKWYIPYCNIAEHLSQQGYDIFVSSHKEVRDRLKQSTERVIAIVPSLKLKDKWIEKLQMRYDESQLEKDYKALMNAKDRFDENIKEIIDDCGDVIEIPDMKYDLDLVIHAWRRKQKSL